MNFELLRVAVALAGTSAAAYQDAKTSFIDDKITISMIALGTILNLATLDQSFVFSSLGVTALIFAVGYLFYRSGQLGGGDVLLFCGIQSLLPLYPYATAAEAFKAVGAGVPPMAVALALPTVPIFLSVYISSAFFGIAGSGIIYAAKLYAKTRFRKLNPDWLTGGAFFALSAAMLYWLVNLFGMDFLRALTVTLFLFPALFLITFKRDISHNIALKWIPLSKMEDEDVIENTLLPQDVVEKYGIGRVLTTDQRKVLAEVERKEKIAKFPVQKDLPRFGPYILLGLLATLYFADPLSAFLFGY